MNRRGGENAETSQRASSCTTRQRSSHDHLLMTRPILPGVGNRLRRRSFAEKAAGERQLEDAVGDTHMTCEERQLEAERQLERQLEAAEAHSRRHPHFGCFGWKAAGRQLETPTLHTTQQETPTLREGRLGRGGGGTHAGWTRGRSGQQDWRWVVDVERRPRISTPRDPWCSGRSSIDRRCNQATDGRAASCARPSDGGVEEDHSDRALSVVKTSRLTSPGVPAGPTVPLTPWE